MTTANDTYVNMNSDKQNQPVDLMTTMIQTNTRQLTALSPSQTIDIRFENISYTVPVSWTSKEHKTVLRGLNGLFKSGELTAIMGPSGSGKSSLLNVLSGFIKEGVSGTVYANGNLVDAKRSQTKSHSAYIMQDDHLNPLFTVDEIMNHAAEVKLRRSTKRKTKRLIIESILESMSMTEAANTRCGNLSGGQRKRLNVCLELIDNPPILFLDEPTSGQDSSSCRLLVSELKSLAESGRTVICTIHQPSAVIFSMFDHLYILSSGVAVYQGHATNLLPFLSFVGLPCPLFHNPADFVMDVITGEFGSYTDKLVEATSIKDWREVPHVKPIDDKPPSDILCMNFKKKENPSEWFRYMQLVIKLYKHLHRDWTVTYLKVLLHALVASIIGALFFRYGDDASKVYSNTVYLFICCIYIIYTTLMPAILKFPLQLLVLKREHFNNWYTFTTWFLAFLAVNIPVQLFFTSVFITTSYLLTGQLLETSRVLMFATSCMFDTIIADMLGLFFGSARDPINGIFSGSAMLIFALVFGGYFVPLKDMSSFMKFLSYFSFIRYTFELKVIAIYGLGRRRLYCPEEALYCHIRNPKLVFESLGLEQDTASRDLIVLSAYTLITILLAFFRLRHCLKQFY